MKLGGARWRAASQLARVAATHLIERRRKRRRLAGAGDLVRLGLRDLFGRVHAAGVPPAIATIAVADGCPLQCWHCSAARPPTTPVDDARLAARVRAVVALGGPVIALTGGEPLTCAALPALLAEIPDDRLAMIYTSGWGLRPNTARELRDRRRLVVAVSIDHTDEAENDRRRGRAGAQEAAVAALAALRGGAAELQVSTVVTPDRLASGELAEFIAWAGARGASVVQLFGPRAVGRLTGQRDRLLGAPDLGALETLVRKAATEPGLPEAVPYPLLESAGALGCCAGYARLHVDIAGNVRPCDFAPRAVGCLDDAPLAELWHELRRQHPAPASACLSDAPESPTSPPAYFRRWGPRAYGLLVHSLSLATTAIRLEPRTPPRGASPTPDADS